MPAHPVQPPDQPATPAIRAFATSERLNQILIEHLAPAVWTARPPGNVRPIVAIFTHMHNVRAKWVRLNAPHIPVPPQLNRARCTPGQARAALTASAASCNAMLIEALTPSGESSKPRIAVFRRDALARPLPVGLEMVGYMLAHEAHHRGQVCMLTHQLGFPLPGRVTAKLWSY